MRKLELFFLEIESFIQYCSDFYNDETGIYPIASREEIEDAVIEYITHNMSIEFDSIDRENVRSIIQPEYKF